MCFSAPASFVTAGITGAIGIVALTRVSEPRELPLAATPLLFALQQSIEGLLWLDLPLAPNGSLSTVLTFLYLFFAEAFWPLYVPIAVWLIEPSEHRRLLMVVCLGVGAGVGAYLLWGILGHPYLATILGSHIVYETGYRQPDSVGSLISPQPASRSCCHRGAQWSSLVQSFSRAWLWPMPSIGKPSFRCGASLRRRRVLRSCAISNGCAGAVCGPLALRHRSGSRNVYPFRPIAVRPVMSAIR